MGTCAPTLVNEVVGNVWIEQVEQLVGTGYRQALHDPEPTLFKTLRPAFASTYIFSPDGPGE